MRLRNSYSSILLLLSIGLFVFAIVQFYCHLINGSMAPKFLAFALHPDLLYLPALFQDLVRDGGRWSGWACPPAPYYVPDLLLFFLLNAFSDKLLTTIFIYGLMQILGLVVATIFLLRAILGRVSGTAVSQVLLLASLLLLQILAVEGFKDIRIFFFAIVLPTAHAGEAVLALVAVGLWLMVWRRTTWLNQISLCLLCCIVTVSDKLFLVQFSIPAILTGVVCVLFKMMPVRMWFRLTTLVTVGGVAGVLLYPMITPHPCFGRMGHYYFMPTWERLPDTWMLFCNDLLFYVQSNPVLWSIWLVWFLVAFGLLVGFVRRRANLKSAGELQRTAFFLAYVILMSVVLIGAMLVTGNYYNRVEFRYLITAILYPLMGWIILAPRLSVKWQELLLAITVGGVGLGLVILWESPSPPDALILSPRVACLDRYAAKHHLTRGLADYDNATHIRLLSHIGLRVNALSQELAFHHFANNRDWAFAPDGAPLTYQFIVLGSLDPNTVRNRFGPPQERWVCSGTEIWRYDHELSLPPEALPP